MRQQLQDWINRYETEVENKMDLIQKNPELQRLCYGYSFIDGNENAENIEVLLVGINPGAGSGIPSGDKDVRYSDYNSFADTLNGEEYKYPTSPFIQQGFINHGI